MHVKNRGREQEKGVVCASQKLVGVWARSGELWWPGCGIPGWLSASTGRRRGRGSEWCPWLRALVDGVAGSELESSAAMARRRCCRRGAGAREMTRASEDRRKWERRARRARCRSLWLTRYWQSTAWLPRGGHGLPASSHGDGSRCCPRAIEGREEGIEARPASASRPEARRLHARRPCPFFSFFNFFLNCFSNTFLSILKLFSEVAPKVKVAPNKILYNFALRCNSKIQIDFELQTKTSSRFE